LDRPGESRYFCRSRRPKPAFFAAAAGFCRPNPPPTQANALKMNDFAFWHGIRIMVSVFL
jgi:hypothetical protein